MRKLTFYVIDTDQNNLNNVKNSIEALYLNATVILQANPFKAIEDVQRIKPHYYISEAMLNTTDGIALAEQIKQNNLLTQIVIMSGNSEYAVQAYRIHAKSFLLKPITIDKIKKYL